MPAAQGSHFEKLWVYSSGFTTLPKPHCSSGSALQEDTFPYPPCGLSLHLLPLHPSPPALLWLLHLLSCVAHQSSLGITGGSGPDQPGPLSAHSSPFLTTTFQIYLPEVYVWRSLLVFSDLRWLLATAWNLSPWSLVCRQSTCYLSLTVHLYNPNQVLPHWAMFCLCSLSTCAPSLK